MMKLENKDNGLYVSSRVVSQWVHSLAKRYSKSDANVNIITNHRGGVPMAIHLNNILEGSTLSILKYQTRTEKKDSQVSWLINNCDPKNINLFMDDIYDTGASSKKCITFLYSQRIFLDIKNIHYLVTKDSKFEACIVLPKENTEWVYFPWEV